MTDAQRLQTEPSAGARDGRWWLFWLIGSVAFLGVTLPNVGLWPTLFQDEMQIIDYGRVFLDPDTTWSTSWFVHESMAMQPTFYLGSVLQEFAYRVFQPSDVGARVSSVLGAILASGAVFGWLRCRNTPALAALALSLAFLLEPMLNQTYRQGRIDSWALLFSVAALWALRSVSAHRPGSGGNAARFFLAGSLGSISVFVWPTSAVLVPLILIEFVHAARSMSDGHRVPGWRSWLGPFTAFSLGGLIALALCLLPLLVNLEASLLSLERSAIAQRAGALVQLSIPDMYITRSPWLLPALLLSLALRREWALIAGLAVAIVMMLQTQVYPTRIIYLLPYLVAIIASAVTTVTASAAAPRRKFWIAALMVLMLGGNLWISAVQRPLLATREAEALSTEQFDRMLGDSIGAGPYRVVTTEWDIYYAARSLGWELYLLFTPVDKEGADFAAFLGSMDFAILRESDEWKKTVTRADVDKAGFVLQAQLSFEPLVPVQPSGGTQPSMPAVGKAAYEDLLVYRNDVREKAREAPRQVTE